MGHGLLPLGFTESQKRSLRQTRGVSLTGLSFSSSSLDTSSGPANLTVTVQATDNLSGLKSNEWWAYVEFVWSGSSNPNVGGIGSFISNPASTTTILTFPQYSATGSWYVHSIQLRDNAGNWTLLNQAQIQALGFPTTIQMTGSPTSSSTTSSTTTTTTQVTTTTTTSSTTTTTTTGPGTTTTTQPPSTTTTTNPSNPSFADVAPSNPYYTQINALSAMGIVTGFGNGTFGPNNLVTRQQFAKMVVRTLNLPVSQNDTCSFTDVGSNLDLKDPLYPDHYVAVCAAQGITEGITPLTFAPYSNLSRAQLITMVARAANLPDPPDNYSPVFGNFSATHYPWARKAAYAGLLQGLQGMGKNYDFWASATRGEVCVMLYNLLNSPQATQGQAIRKGIAAELGADFQFTISRLKVVGSWAGAVVTPINANVDPAEFLLRKDPAGWTVIDYGTGYTADDWLADGAPAELANWFDTAW